MSNPPASASIGPCSFCRVISGELPSSRVAGNTLVMAFLDLSPVNGGHTLVVPLRHVASLTDLTPAEFESMARTAQQVAAALKAVLPECDGVTLSMADGEVAGQEVPHAHLHVIPRYRNDGFGWRRLGNSMDRAQLNEMASQIRSSMEISGAGQA